MLRTEQLRHPARTRPLGHARGCCYRGPWRLPEPDSHRLAALGLPLGYISSSFLRRPERLDTLGRKIGPLFPPYLRIIGSKTPLCDS